MLQHLSRWGWLADVIAVSRRGVWGSSRPVCRLHGLISGPRYTGPSEARCTEATPFSWEATVPLIAELLAPAGSYRVDLIRSWRLIAAPRGGEPGSRPGGQGGLGGTDMPLSGGSVHMMRCRGGPAGEDDAGGCGTAAVSRVRITLPRAWAIPREAVPGRGSGGEERCCPDFCCSRPSSSKQVCQLE